MDYANLVMVHECGSEIEANLAKGARQAAGIDAMIQADTAGTPTGPHRLVGWRLQASGARRRRRRRPRIAGRAVGGIARRSLAPPADVVAGSRAEAISPALGLTANRSTRRGDATRRPVGPLNPVRLPSPWQRHRTVPA
jgi:hypothetical protein